MGLAERFRDKLKNNDIYKNNNIEQILEESKIKFISKPIEENTGTVSIVAQNPVIQNIDIEDDSSDIKLDNLETELINKIRKTPYWCEYSLEKQEKMIENYYNARLKTKYYSTINHTATDKNNFIKTLLTLANNR